MTAGGEIFLGGERFAVTPVVGGPQAKGTASGAESVLAQDRLEQELQGVVFLVGQDGHISL